MASGFCLFEAGIETMPSITPTFDSPSLFIRLAIVAGLEFLLALKDLYQIYSSPSKTTAKEKWDALINIFPKAFVCSAWAILATKNPLDPIGIGSSLLLVASTLCYGLKHIVPRRYEIQTLRFFAQNEPDPPITDSYPLDSFLKSIPHLPADEQTYDHSSNSSPRISS
jgi:hypothetical protein